MAVRPDQEQLYRDFHDKILHYIWRKTGNYDTAEDLTSVVFLKVCEKYETYDESKAAFSTWLYTIAANTVTDHFRVHKVTEEVPETIADKENIEEGYLKTEQLLELADALKTLPERERDLIILHYYQGVTLKETAVLLKMSYANVKLVHAKALGKMKKLLDL